MRIWKTSIQIGMSLVMAWTPVAAQMKSSPAQIEKAATSLWSSADLEVRHLQGRTQYVRRASNGQESVVEFPVTPKEELRKYSPKSLMSEFTRGLKNGKPIKTIATTAKRFPVEATLFFMATGGVTALQLFTDYSSNPVAMEQHIEHSFSPLGMFSFYTFIYANSVTTNVLSSWVSNPKYYVFIPYLGMTAGFFVQSYISTVATDPLIQACVAQMKGEAPKAGSGVDAEDPCEAAYEKYVTGGLLREMAPGLFSMLAATALASAIQIGARSAFLNGSLITYKITPAAGRHAVKIAVNGLRLAFSYHPVMAVTQMFFFVYLDQAILHKPVNYAWKNYFDGRALRNIERELVDKISVKKKIGWSELFPRSLCDGMKDQAPEACTRELSDAIKDFHVKMNEWRTFNLLDVHTAHANWQSHLSKLNGMYDVSFHFYKDFVDEAFKGTDGSTSRLDTKDLFFGVTPEGIVAGEEDIMFSRSDLMIPLEHKKVREVGAWLQAELGRGSRGSERSMRAIFNEHGKAALFDQIATQLQSQDPLIQAAGLESLYLESAPKAGHLTVAEYFAKVNEIRRKIGVDPRPIHEPGRGFFERFERWSKVAPRLEGLAFDRITGRFRTPKVTSHLLLQMMCGPETEKGQSVIEASNGFPAHFVAPRIAFGKGSRPNACERVGAELDSRFLFTAGPGVEDAGVKYASALDFVKKNIPSRILGSKEQSGFLKWWEDNVDKQMIKAYGSFGESYKNIVRELIGTLWTSEDSSWNQGPVANGIVESIRQQMRFDLMVLGELFKDNYAYQVEWSKLQKALREREYEKQQNLLERVMSERKDVVAELSTKLPGHHFDDRQEPEPLVSSDGGEFRLFEALRRGGRPKNVPVPLHHQTSIFEWDRLAASSNVKTAKSRGRALKFQKEIELEFEKLFGLLYKIRVDGSGKIISGDLENAALEEQSKAIMGRLGKLSEEMGLTAENFMGSRRNLPERVKIAIACIEGLQEISKEVVSYARVANAVSWEKMNKVNDLNGLKVPPGRGGSLTTFGR